MTEVRYLARSLDPSINVLFVHGLGGHLVSTWNRNGSESENDDSFWPRWLTEEKDIKAAVFLVGYPSRWRIREMARGMLETLIADSQLASNDKPIVFVCHSLGGLIVKKLILEANDDVIENPDRNQEQRKFLDRIRGVVFLATPHSGSEIATMADWIPGLSSDAKHDLEQDNPVLVDLSKCYRDYIADRNRAYIADKDKQKPIQHKIFYEKRRVGLVISVVDPDSADPNIIDEDAPIPIDEDHRNICKPDSHDIDVYKIIKMFLKKIIWSPFQGAAPTAWLTIKGITGFGLMKDAYVCVTATVNDVEYIYPSLSGVKWLQVGPEMAPQTFQIPVRDFYRIRFSAKLRDPVSDSTDLASVEEQHVTGKTDGVAVYCLRFVHWEARDASPVVEIHYTISQGSP